MNNCRICNCVLSDDNWMNSLKNKNSKICRNCNNTKGREWRNNNKEKSNLYQLNRYYNNPKKVHEIVNKSRKKVRIDMIIEYGGKCVYCNINDFEVLDIDHISNDGAIDRKNGLFGYNLYRYLKKNKWPKDNFQLLCKNCNWKKELRRRRESSLSNI